MPIPAKTLVRALISTTLACTGIAGQNPPSFQETRAAEAGWWNKPSTFSLEARTVEHDGAVGVHLVRPLFSTGSSDVLLEGYGFEGEGDLGLAGVGLIHRHALSSRSAFEVNAFFEGLRSTDGFAYPQFGAGIGYTHDWWTVRANGYLPLQGKDRRHAGTERWSEIEGSGASRRAVSFSRERFSERAPMRGFDVEAELRLPNPPRWVDPRLAVGYAYREAEDRPEVYAGPTVRGELHFGRHWVAESEWRGDAHGINQEWRAGVRFEMLFGGPAGRDEQRDDKQVRDGKQVRTASADHSSDPAENGERYLPAKRFPWPTLARGTARGKAQRGDSRALGPNPDCGCVSGPPLIFD